MDIVNEIDRLPQYYYMLKNGEIILGGNTGNYYEKETLSDNEKREYAQMVYKMMQHSEGRKIDRKELKEIINKLSEDDKEEIAWQIDMYKKGREYYSQYVN